MEDGTGVRLEEEETETEGEELKPSLEESVRNDVIAQNTYIQTLGRHLGLLWLRAGRSSYL